MQAAAALRLDPIACDDLVVESGVLAMQCSPGGPDALARALGLDRTRGYQLRKGDRTGAFYRVAVLGDALAGGEGVTTAPLLVFLRTRMIKEQLKRMDEVQLRARWAELEGEETGALARLEAARDHRDRAAERQAMKDVAAVMEDRVAIDEIMLRLPGRPDPRRLA